MCGRSGYRTQSGTKTGSKSEVNVINCLSVVSLRMEALRITRLGGQTAFTGSLPCTCVYLTCIKSIYDIEMCLIRFAC